MRFCSNCGAQLPDGTKFCQECGQKVSEPVAPVQEAPAAPVQEAPAAPAYEAPAAPVQEAPAAPVQEAPAAPVQEAPAAPAYAAPAAPVQEAPAAPVYAAPAAPVQEAPAAPAYSAPAQNYSAAPNGGGATPPPPYGGGSAAPAYGGGNVPPQKKKSKTGLIVGLSVGGAVVLIGIVVLVLFLTGILGGKGKGGSAEVLGRYEGVSCMFGDLDLGAEGEWIELKERGQGSLCIMGEEGVFTWTLVGTTFTMNDGGDDYEGTLEDGVLTVDFYGMVYTFAKDGADVSGSGSLTLPTPAEPEPEPEPEPELEPQPLADYDWWDGEWYGWIVVNDAGGSYTEWIDKFGDCIADISVNDDGTGYFELRDLDDAWICDLEITIGEGSTGMGKLTSGSGSFREDNAIAPGDWEVDPAQTMVSELEHMLCINDTIYVDDEGWFDYYIFLRPWGMDWEDVRTADTSDMLYDDMMPLNYDDWYLDEIGGVSAPAGGEGNDLMVIGDYEALYKGYELVTDNEGDDAIALYFDFTNNSAEEESVFWALYYYLYQDGVELDSTTVYVNGDSMTWMDDSTMDDVPPGQTRPVCITYKLRDTTTPVELEMTDLYDTATEYLTIDLSTAQ